MALGSRWRVLRDVILQNGRDWFHRKIVLPQPTLWRRVSCGSLAWERAMTRLKVTLLSMVGLLGGCEREAPEREGIEVVEPHPSGGVANAGPPRYTVSPSVQGGIAATVEADAVISNRRPELTFGCDDGRTKMVFFDFRQAPQSPPPLRGTFAQLSADGALASPIELSWTGIGGQWTVREESVQAIARRLLVADQIALQAPPGFGPDATINWSIAGFGDELPTVRRQCGAE
jgi:hypothetical protein